MSKETWDSFPTQEVVGKHFVLYEQSRSIEGVIASIKLYDDFVEFYATANADCPMAGGAMGLANWSKTNENEICISVPFIGMLLISTA